MIYFVDEDYSAYESWIAELELRGYGVMSLRSADEAFNTLYDASPDNVQLVIIDVMLAVDDVSDPRFAVALTDTYLEAGLRLLENLVEQKPAVFPHRAVLLTNTISEKTLTSARKVSTQFGIELWDKREMMSPLDFGDRVLSAVVAAAHGEK